MPQNTFNKHQCNTAYDQVSDRAQPTYGSAGVDKRPGAPLFHIEHHIDKVYTKYNFNSGFVEDTSFQSFHFWAVWSWVDCGRHSGCWWLIHRPANPHSDRGRVWWHQSLQGHGSLLSFPCLQWYSSKPWLTPFDLSTVEHKELKNSQSQMEPTTAEEAQLPQSTVAFTWYLVREAETLQDAKSHRIIVWRWERGWIMKPWNIQVQCKCARWKVSQLLIADVTLLYVQSLALHDFAACNGDINSMLFISRTFDSDLNLVIILVSHKGPLFSPNLSNPSALAVQSTPGSWWQCNYKCNYEFCLYFLYSSQFNI